MLNNMKIAHRFALLGALLILMLLGGGITGYFGVYFQNEKLNEVLIRQTEALTATHQANDALDAFRLQNQELKTALLRGDDVERLDKHKAALKANERIVQSKLAALMKAPAGADPKKIAALAKQHAQVSARYDKAMVEYDPINPLGSAILIDGMIKGLDEPIANGLVQLRQSLEKHLVDQGAEDAASAGAIYRMLSVVFVVCTILGVALGAAAFVWIARNLLAQLGGEPAEAVEIAHRIADGDLGAQVRIKAGDSSSLLAAIADMQQQLRTLIERVHTSAHQLSGQATALSASSTEIAQSSGYQTEAASSMASSIEQMTASIGQVAEHSNEALEISRASGDLSNRGNEVVASAAAEMEQIAASAHDLTQIIETLGSQSSQISRIVHVIQEIANQTNLLALNAAIEAARAGEQGRGFSVVAEEVRKLAERTTDSTREIAGMIQAIQDGTGQAVRHMEGWSARVSEGVSKAKGAGDYMRDIKTGANQVLSVVNEISHALGEQSSASSQIAQTVERIAHMSQENSTAVGSVANSAKRLEELAHGLQAVVAHFKLQRA